MPEMVSRPRCPSHSGPGWWPRSSIQAVRSFLATAGRGDVVDFVAFAMQPDAAGAGSDRDVFEVEAFAFLDPGAGVEQHGDDRRVAGAAAQGGTFDFALLGRAEGIWLARPGDTDAFDRDAQSGTVLVEQGDGGKCLVDRGGAGLLAVPQAFTPRGDRGLGADDVGERVGVVRR